MKGMNRISLILRIALLPALFGVVSCSGGVTVTDIVSRPTTTHIVTLSWAPNRESGVNSAGGYYEVSISTMPAITVPYTTTSVTTILPTGSYAATVRAHAALDSQGSTTGAGSFSAPSQALMIAVP